MKLTYLWIKDFRNIVDQEFNFGSDYFYSLKRTPESLELSRAQNGKNIPGLFKIKGRGFENITAIVGDNGSGKSNLIEFIRGIIKDRHSGNDFGKRYIINDFIAIFSKETKSHKEKAFVFLNTDESDKVKINFPFSHSYKIEAESIFYAPAYDFKLSTLGFSDNPDVDVSSNYLLEKDYDDERFGFSSLNQGEHHELQNVRRQVSFVTQFARSFEINEVIKLPKAIDIIIRENHSSDLPKKGNFHNTPSEFREYYKKGVEKWRDEMQKLNSEEHSLNGQKKRNRKKYLELQSQKFYAFFLRYLWQNVFTNFEHSNRFLEEGRSSMPITENKLSLEKFITKFLKSQNIFKPNATLTLISRVKTLTRLTLYADVHGEDKHMTVPFNSKVKALQTIYQEHLDQMYIVAGYHQPVGFLNFKWSELSSGEKAYLDLFSRLFHSKRVLHERIREDRGEGIPKRKFPNNIFLLLDEAELGFHLQWQKEFVYKLINTVPLLFKRESPKIQLIFTTHSPISLSDIPSSNVIFLTKENGNCKVIANSSKPKHSFGANIHEMLYDAFYLKDGFMGTFAKSKIQNAIDWCLSKKSSLRSKDKVERLINAIDDPIIKFKLQEMFAKKMGLNPEVERLKSQLELIQGKL